jgi:hypothetical protein
VSRTNAAHSRWEAIQPPRGPVPRRQIPRQVLSSFVKIRQAASRLVKAFLDDVLCDFKGLRRKS